MHTRQVYTYFICVLFPVPVSSQGRQKVPNNKVAHLSGTKNKSRLEFL